jgi:hypothetical protein
MREKIKVYNLLVDQSTTGSSDAVAAWYPKKSFQVIGTTTSGAGSATVVIETSNKESSDDDEWLTAATVTLTIADENTPNADGFVMDAAWRYVRARVSAISGTGALVNVDMGHA